MNARSVSPPWFPRLPFFLILTHLCLVLAVRGQDAPAADDQSATAAPAEAAPSEPAPVSAPVLTEPGISGGVAPGVTGTPEFGVPYSSVAQTVNMDPFRTLDPFGAQIVSMNVNAYPRLGNLQGSMTLGAGGISMPAGIFVNNGPPPQNADLKIGPLYFKLDNLTADLLYTDNYRLTETNRQSETFAIIAMNMSMLVQLTDDLQFTVTGVLFYLPIQNIVGFDTSALGGGLGFLLGVTPLLSTNVTYDVLVAGWPVQLSDQFQTSAGSYSDSTLDSFSFFNGSALQQTGNGKYVFHSGLPDQRDLNNGTSNASAQNDYFTLFANNLSAITSNTLPGDVQVTARADRADLWYDSDNRGLPSSWEDFSVVAETARPNMRFTLFATYDVSHSSNVPGVYQTVTAGLFGPINDQLFLRAFGGFFISNTGEEGEVWTVDLRHNAGPYTTEEAEVAQGLSDFNQEIITTEYYRITQILGPTINAIGFADHSSFQELSNTQSSNRSQEDAGAELSWFLGPKTTLNMAGIYTHQNFDNGSLTDTWSGRITLWRTISDTMFFSAFYQYQRYSTNQLNNGYYENLIFLSLVKYFP